MGVAVDLVNIIACSDLIPIPLAVTGRKGHGMIAANDDIAHAVTLHLTRWNA
jgi:hypothetical protein